MGRREDSDRGLTILLNNAGILSEYRTNQEPKRKDLTESFNVNVASAAVITQSALNSLMKTMSIDLEQDHILVVMFCPGWVTKDLGGPDARFTLDQSIEELVPSIYKLSKEHHGGYFNRDLTKIPF
ncbi:c-factor domain protein [Ancylostoma duodenale]|uniref:C-factor domain protein n=1 Tax=Ancylostoma duodenale TaxID=51022 RepID=A0A0C2CY86_9BILA|nr:c-factor domain protein [Ancylostoma duodenale]